MGFGAFLAALPRGFLSLGVLIAIAGWVATENLGGILAGSTADVGTGPVLILLALAFWPVRARARSRQAGQQRADEASPLAPAQREAQSAAGSDPAG